MADAHGRVPRASDDVSYRRPSPSPIPAPSGMFHWTRGSGYTKFISVNGAHHRRTPRVTPLPGARGVMPVKNPPHAAVRHPLLDFTFLCSFPPTFPSFLPPKAAPAKTNTLLAQASECFQPLATFSSTFIHLIDQGTTVSAPVLHRDATGRRVVRCHFILTRNRSFSTNTTSL